MKINDSRLQLTSGDCKFEKSFFKYEKPFCKSKNRKRNLKIEPAKGKKTPQIENRVRKSKIQSVSFARLNNESRPARISKRN